MIKRFRVQNFKGIRDADLELRPITILIGANDSGKSTIAQALLLIKQSMYLRIVSYFESKKAYAVDGCKIKESSPLTKFQNLR
ncbi:MAG: AAA family ATPase [Candidatus Heimdallarchaeota archaeon]